MGDVMVASTLTRNRNSAFQPIENYSSDLIYPGIWCCLKLKKTELPVLQFPVERDLPEMCSKLFSARVHSTTKMKAGKD